MSEQIWSNDARCGADGNTPRRMFRSNERSNDARCGADGNNSFVLLSICTDGRMTPAAVRMGTQRIVADHLVRVGRMTPAAVRMGTGIAPFVRTIEMVE